MGNVREEDNTLPVPLSVLVDRLRSSTPDRELDVTIWLSVVSGTTRRITRYVHIASGRDQMMDQTRDGAGALITVPAYTQSVDAAISLLPAGYVWGCGFSRFVPHTAWVSSSPHADGQFVGECDGGRAIAVCIAAVKAIAATAGEIL